MNAIDVSIQRRAPWNKGKLTGQKAPLKDAVSDASNVQQGRNRKRRAIR